MSKDCVEEEDTMMVKDKPRVCLFCRWRKHEDISDGYVCVNYDSEHVADWVDDDDGCAEWEDNAE